MVIGITGSSGAGKSTVCEILESEYGAKIINADKIAKELSKKGTAYLNEIVKVFGNEILQEDGELNRKKLANIIYLNEEKRNSLNNCTFKYIKKEIINQINEAEQFENEKTRNTKKQIINRAPSIIAIDAPLLFEANLEKICNITIAVVSESKEAQIERIIKRDGIDRNHALNRLNAQHENNFYIQNCMYKIINNENVNYLKEQIKKIMSENMK